MHVYNLLLFTNICRQISTHFKLQLVRYTESSVVYLFLSYLMTCVQKFNLSFALFSFNNHLIDPSDCLTAPCDALLLDMYTLEIKDLEVLGVCPLYK